MVVGCRNMKSNILYHKEVTLHQLDTVTGCFDATIVTWVEERPYIFKKWSWRKFGWIEEKCYKYYIRQNDPRLKNAKYMSEINTNDIIHLNMLTQIELANMWVAKNLGNVELETC